MGNSCFKVVKNETEFERPRKQIKSKLKKLHINQSLLTEQKLGAIFQDIIFKKIENLSFGANSCISLKGWGMIRSAVVTPSAAVLRSLHVQKCGLCCNKVEQIFRDGWFPNVTTINLHGNSIISNEGWATIAQRVITPSAASIRTIVFQDCVIDSEIAKTIFAPKAFPAITEFDLKGNNKIAENCWSQIRKSVLERGHLSISKLNMQNCQLDQVKVHITFSNLTFHRLQSLHLGMNSRITPEGWNLVRQQLILPSQHTLRSINLQWCELEQASIQAIFHNLQLCKIIDLNLGGNPRISSEGWQLVNENLVKPSSVNMRHVLLWQCSLDDVKIAKLFDDAQFYNMLDLDIGMNPDLTENGWNIVNKHLIQPSSHSVKTIHLQFCKLINDQTEILFTDKKLKNLTFLDLGMNSDLNEQDINLLETKFKEVNQDFAIKF